jgi:hypothetical protein
MSVRVSILIRIAIATRTSMSVKPLRWTKTGERMEASVAWGTMDGAIPGKLDAWKSTW